MNKKAGRVAYDRPFFIQIKCQSVIQHSLRLHSSVKQVLQNYS